MANDLAGKIKDAMAKVQALQKAATELRKPENMRELGNSLASMIKIRTRVGFGVDAAGESKHPLKPLLDSYIEQRKAQGSFAQRRAENKFGKDNMDKLGKNQYRDKVFEQKGLYPETTASKSNLTRSGQMLNSIDVKKVETGRVSVGPTGNRTDTDKTNSEIAEYNAEKGRSFNYPSDIELKRLNDSIKTKLKTLMRGLLTK